jgi:hypothetical protein
VKSLLLALCLATGLYAQTSPLTFYIHDTTGQIADTPLPAIYQFNSTAVGSGTPIVLKGFNSSGAAISLTLAYVSNTAGDADNNRNYSLTGLFYGLVIPAGGSVIFTVSFAPVVTGPLTGYLQIDYQVQQPNCVLGAVPVATTPVCPSSISPVSTLTGTATTPVLVLSYPNPDGSGPLVPQAGSQISFGNVSTSASHSTIFTLTNQSSVATSTPAVSLSVPQSGGVPQATAYQVNTTQSDGSAYPASLPPNSSATFTVTFAPGQTGLAGDAFLNVGSNSYRLIGAGIVVADIDALQIADVNAAGIITPVQAATPISFDKLVAGISASSTLSFCVTNPLSSFNAVNVSVAVSGAGFALASAPSSANCQSTPCPSATLAGSIPAGSSGPLIASIPVCQALAFNLTFTPGAAAGAVGGTLSFTGSTSTRSFTLSGQSVATPFPALSLHVTPTLLSSQQQATITLNLASPTAITAIGALSLAFQSAVGNVTDDPAVAFTSPSGRNESITFAVGSQTSPAYTFQTGTTAGTLTFTTQNFVNTAPYSQSFTIPAAAVLITSGTAVRQTPNLVITLNGYDNTYTAGQLSFSFFDVSGNLLQPAIQFDASIKFKQYFFTNNQNGGAFSLQATFPDTGDITKVGSVAVTLSNSTGQTTVTETFQ